MPQLDERTGVTILIAGVCLFVIGWLWLVVLGFGTSTCWGFVALIPGFNLLFPLCRFRRAALPLAVMLIGALVAATPYAINAIVGERVSTDARIEEKPGEQRITLTKA